MAIAARRENSAEPNFPQEFAAIYQEHSKPIYYFILRYLGDPSLAEDATHDVFVKAFKNLAKFRRESSVRTWLYRIALNHCKNLRQTWHARKIQYESEIGDQLLQNNSDTPLQILETSELGDRIQTTLDALPKDYAVLLVMVADERMSYERIAELTDQTTDAVRGKLYRARKAFSAEFSRHH